MTLSLIERTICGSTIAAAVADSSFDRLMYIDRLISLIPL